MHFLEHHQFLTVNSSVEFCFLLQVLIEFFCVDGVGIPLDKMMTDTVKVRNILSIAFTLEFHVTSYI